MSALPSSFTTPSVTRAGTLISELNIIVPRAYNQFIDKWKFVPIVMMNELAGNEMPTDNKLFYHYEQAGRAMGFVQSAAAVTVAAGAPATITVAAGAYSASGTRSLPNEGQIYYNARTGIESRVSAVPNKSTPYAHTFVLTPVISTENASTLAGDVLQNRGYKYLGEASDYTGTEVRNIDKYTNFCTQIRKDSKFTDLSMAERIDFEIDGQRFYKYKQLKDDNYEMMLQKEVALMDSNLTNNLGYNESGTAGVIQQVQANGTTQYYSTMGAQTTFAQIERQIDSQGGPGEYDWLSDTNQSIEIQNALGNDFNNGAILYAQTGNMDNLDLARGFKSFTPYHRKYNFTRYLPFSQAAFYGNNVAGTTRDNFGLLIPKGTGQDARTKNIVPNFCIRYQNIPGFGKVVIGETGGLSPNGKTTKLELDVFQQMYYGVMVFAPNQYILLKKS
jgi:hypothetical protein